MEKYRDSNYAIGERVADLISRMTIEQKVSQLQCLMFMSGDIEDVLNKFPDSIGTLTGFSGAQTVEGNAELNNKIQDIVADNSDLEIPVLIHCEALTGMNAVGGTIFPSAIALGATWNPDTVEKMTDIVRRQMLAVGIRHALSPVMDVARDPRWGRVGETYGEDPTLCAAMSVAFTKGLQGEDLSDGVVATGKHFLGYGFGDGGLNMSSNPIPPRELREVYAKPFQAAITEGGLEGVMNSYGTIDGEMVITSKHILNDLLRNEMGFEGILVSDYMSINRAVGFRVTENPATGGVEALMAGLDVELPMPYGFVEGLVDAVKAGKLDEAYVDRALARLLSTKFKLGLFENAQARKEQIPVAYGTPEAREHSLRAAREATVLLKNTGVLPLSKDIKKIAVIGPHADSIRLLFGCYTYPASIDMGLSGAFSDMAGQVDSEMSFSAGQAPEVPFFENSNVRKTLPKVEQALQHLFGQKTPTILAAIKAKCPEADCTYEYGCDIAGTDRSGFDAAIAAAKSADVVILTLGGKYGWGNNCTSGEGVDTYKIGLTGVQEELARLIFETGTPAIFVHMDAKPLSSEYVAENYPAIIEYWFPGETGGEALADILFGDFNPAGRLPITAAREAGQVPIYAAHPYGNSYGEYKNLMLLNTYVEGLKEPLFYFGEGMSYSTFEYSNLQVTKEVKLDELLHVSCDVKNVGDRDGDEVVQVYVRDEFASMLRPIKELAGFGRVHLKSGESKQVEFTMKPDQFAFLDKDMNWVVEAGEITVMVGASSEDIRLRQTCLISESAQIVGKDRGFFAQVHVD